MTPFSEDDWMPAFVNIINHIGHDALSPLFVFHYPSIGICNSWPLLWLGKMQRGYIIEPMDMNFLFKTFTT